MKVLTRMLPVAALFAITTFAQGPFGVLTSATPPDTATVVANKVRRLTSLLTLTTAQATQAATIFTNALNAVAPIETTLSGYHTSLQAAVKTNSTSVIDNLSAQIGTAHGQITAIQNKADAAFYALLTADQKAKLDAANNGFGGGGRGHR